MADVGSLDWAVILAAATLICTIIGGMLTAFYKLIVANQAKTTQLYDERVAGAVRTFEAAITAKDTLGEERIAAYKQDVSALRKRQDMLEQELRETLKDLSRNYVPREDFLKSVTVLELKLDRLGEAILQMAKEK